MSQSFGYDHLNRLTNDSIAGQAGTGIVSWSYDPFGNRLSQGATGSLSFSLTQISASYNGQSLTNGTLASGVYSNRMDNVNHDASGNVLQYGVMALTYDAASRVRTAGSVCYVYGVDGHFTGKEWDAESGLDYCGARYFGSKGSI